MPVYSPCLCFVYMINFFHKYLQQLNPLLFWKVFNQLKPRAYHSTSVGVVPVFRNIFSTVWGILRTLSNIYNGELCVKIVNGLQVLVIFPESTIFDILRGLIHLWQWYKIFLVDYEQVFACLWFLLLNIKWYTFWYYPSMCQPNYSSNLSSGTIFWKPVISIEYGP